MGAGFLLVEDDGLVVSALTRLLRPYGSVTHCRLVRDGRRRLGGHDAWCAVIVDPGLPDGDGVELVAEVRARGRTMPILVLTGSHGADVARRAYELDAEYLPKPARAEHVVAFARRAMQRHAGILEMALGWARQYQLTVRERQLLERSALGVERSELAAEMGISRLTLDTHVHNLVQKTGDRSLDIASARLLRECVAMAGGAVQAPRAVSGERPRVTPGTPRRKARGR